MPRASCARTVSGSSIARTWTSRALCSIFHLNKTPETAASIQVRHLLSHTSGLFDYGSDMASAAEQGDAWVAEFVTGPMADVEHVATPPGAVFAYANLNFVYRTLTSPAADFLRACCEGGPSNKRDRVLCDLDHSARPADTQPPSAAFVRRLSTYETAVAEERWVWADARRKGDAWHVVLSSGTIPGWGRRGPQAHIARGSYRAPGVVEESFAGRTAHVLDAERLNKLEAFVEQGRRTAQIPGLALAVVQGGKVVFEKGFGTKQLGKQAPVTPNTMFRIASMTKPLTSLMMASLVDDKIFTWDTPVTEILPSFALGDPELTKKLTMRNVLCACTGIPYDNLGVVFQSAGVTAEKMMERMKELKPTTGYGETFQYSNAMIAAAGFLAAHAANPRAPMSTAYQSAMQARIFGPLGMKHTTFDAKKAQRSDHAWPHDRNLNFEIEATGRDTAAWITPMNPGGGAWSTVHDLSQVLLMELAKGKTPEGKQVISEQNLLARREPQARAGEKVSYGLALAVEKYRDVQGYGHGGGLWGYSSFMFFLPDHDVGAVMLTNIGFPNPFVYAQFPRKIFELLFDGRDEAREDLDMALDEAKAWRKEINKRFDLSPGKAFFEPFVGRYKHPLYGEIKVSFDATKGAWLDVGEWRSRLGKKREEDGTEKLVTTSAPWLDWPEFVRKERDGKPVLEFQDGQRKVILERLP